MTGRRRAQRTIARGDIALAKFDKAVDMTTIGSTTAAIPEPQGGDRPVPVAAAQARLLPPRGAFFPVEPATLEETGLSPNDVEPLVLKLLLTSGPTVGRKIADQVRLPFALMTELLRSLRTQLLLGVSNQGTMGDFEYDLTGEGRERAQWLADRCTYCGSAPVPLNSYLASVEAQSIRKAKVRLSHVSRALSDLMLMPAAVSQLGQAVNAGRGLFLYGPPGNGKTSIAERLVRAMSPYLWIPRTITTSGEVIRLFDPVSHTEEPFDAPSENLLDMLRFDRRWVRIRRPLVVVGGELKLDQLEVAHNPTTGILEAPVQLKSNGGTLVVDDFGRQRCSTAELLNRWIVPLEKGYDYLNLPSGRQIQIPFDQLLVFSTNLPPHDLVDEAFLRRIPYKIEVTDPTPAEFRTLVQQWCGKLGIEFQSAAVDYLLVKHYHEAKRPLRYCHARDLVQQVLGFCEFQERPLVLTPEAFDAAARNYFAGL
jgi:hypothetical protein